VKVVDVAVMFQPRPDPVASATSKDWAVVTAWSSPFNATANPELAGLVTNARLPALIVAVTGVAAAGGTTTTPAPTSITTERTPRRRHACTELLLPCDGLEHDREKRHPEVGVSYR